MKIRRKIWSLPLVLVTALLLVGLLGAVVLAVGAGDAPREEALIPDQTLVIGATGAVDAENDGTPGNVTIGLADVDNDPDADLDGDGDNADPAYSDYIDRSADPPVADPLIYTAMTTDGALRWLTWIHIPRIATQVAKL